MRLCIADFTGFDGKVLFKGNVFEDGFGSSAIAGDNTHLRYLTHQTKALLRFLDTINENIFVIMITSIDLIL